MTTCPQAAALLRLGKVQDAADRAKLVGQNAGDHVHAHAVSALTLAAAGRIEEARAERRCISEFRPDYNFRQFKKVLHLLDDLTDIYQRAAKLLEIPERGRVGLTGATTGIKVASLDRLAL